MHSTRSFIMSTASKPLPKQRAPKQVAKQPLIKQRATKRRAKQHAIKRDLIKQGLIRRRVIERDILKAREALVSRHPEIVDSYAHFLVSYNRYRKMKRRAKIQL